MKIIFKTLLGAAMGLGMATAAHAEITPAHMQQLIASKGLTVAGSDRSDDGSLDVIAVTDRSGWPFAFSLLDFDSNGSKDLLMMLTFVPNRQPPLQFINSVNENAASKAFVTGGNATLTYVHLGIGAVDPVTLNAAFDIYLTEWRTFAQQVMQQSQGNGGGNFLGVSNIDPDAIDAGMSRIAVTARDADLTAALNQPGSHAVLVANNGPEIADIDELMALASEAARSTLARN